MKRRSRKEKRRRLTPRRLRRPRRRSHPPPSRPASARRRQSRPSALPRCVCSPCGVRWSAIICYLLPVTCCLLPASCYLLPVTCCQCLSLVSKRRSATAVHAALASILRIATAIWQKLMHMLWSPIQCHMRLVSLLVYLQVGWAGLLLAFLQQGCGGECTTETRSEHSSGACRPPRRPRPQRTRRTRTRMRHR